MKVEIIHHQLRAGESTANGLVAKINSLPVLILFGGHTLVLLPLTASHIERPMINENGAAISEAHVSPCEVSITFERRAAKQMI